MSIFHEVGLTWKGTEYTVPADKVMGLIAEIEEVLTFEELAAFSEKGLKRVGLSRAYVAALTYAGVKDVKQEEVYSALFDPSRSIEMQTIVATLLTMMIPPEHLQEKPKAPTKKPKRKTSAKS